METILFLCTHNAGRSQMAAAFFNSMAHEHCARALSAGTAVAERVFTEVVEAMRERKIDLGGARPQRVSPELLARARRIITMGCGALAAQSSAQLEDWAIDDPQGRELSEVRRIRDQIERRVWKMIVREGWVRLQPRALSLQARR